MAGPSAAPLPSPADVGIVAALDLEVGYLTDRLERVRRYAGPGQTVVEGEHAGKLVALIVGGVGRASARKAAAVLLDGHRPRWLISAGFAGALDPALRRNDAVFPTQILGPDGVAFAVDVQIPPGPSTGGPRLRTGRLATVDAIVRTTAEKAALRERTGADVVDMESSAVASVCNDRAIRFLGIRVVSDDAATELPAEVARLLTRSGVYRAGAALRAVVGRPSVVKDFVRLHAHAQEAADRLADVTLAALSRLPP